MNRLTIQKAAGSRNLKSKHVNCCIQRRTTLMYKTINCLLFVLLLRNGIVEERVEDCWNVHTWEDTNLPWTASSFCFRESRQGNLKALNYPRFFSLLYFRKFRQLKLSPQNSLTSSSSSFSRVVSSLKRLYNFPDAHAILVVSKTYWKLKTFLFILAACKSELAYFMPTRSGIA